MTTINGDNNDNINVGDIVHIDGYGKRRFEIISITRTHYIDLEMEYEVAEIEALDLRDKRNYYAELEDITVIESAKPGKSSKHPDHVLITADIVDDLLDEMRSWRTRLQVYGKDRGQGREIIKRMDEVKRQLGGGVDGNALRETLFKQGNRERRRKRISPL